MDDLEKRLINTEKALVALWALLKDTVPPAYEEGIEEMMSDYFTASTKLNADFSCGFIDE